MPKKHDPKKKEKREKRGNHVSKKREEIGMIQEKRKPLPQGVSVDDHNFTF